jgi:hypothetical protein
MYENRLERSFQTMVQLFRLEDGRGKLLFFLFILEERKRLQEACIALERSLKGHQKKWQRKDPL